MSGDSLTAYYLDSNVFLLAFSGNPHAISWLKRVAEGSLAAVTSCLTWDEVVWNLRKKGMASPEEIAYQSQQLLSFPHLGFVEVNEEILASAHIIMKNLRLKPRDSIHAVSCASRGSSMIVSDDPDFDVMRNIKRIPIQNVANY